MPEPDLTFATADAKFGVSVTKSRVMAVVVGLLYLSVTLVFGIVHHHQHDSSLSDHPDCAACAWHVAGVTDVPLVRPLVFGPVVERPFLPADSTPHSAASFVFYLCRAPPVTPA
jgi:hypothetical protein